MSQLVWNSIPFSLSFNFWFFLIYRENHDSCREDTESNYQTDYACNDYLDFKLSWIKRDTSDWANRFLWKQNVHKPIWMIILVFIVSVINLLLNSHLDVSAEQCQIIWQKPKSKTIITMKLMIITSLISYMFSSWIRLGNLIFSDIVKLLAILFAIH